MNMMVR